MVFKIQRGAVKGPGWVRLPHLPAREDRKVHNGGGDEAYTFTPRKAPEIEVIEIIEKEIPNTWTVLLKFESGGKKVMATVDIEGGKVVAGSN